MEKKYTQLGLKAEVFATAAGVTGAPSLSPSTFQAKLADEDINRRKSKQRDDVNKQIKNNVTLTKV